MCKCAYNLGSQNEEQVRSSCWSHCVHWRAGHMPWMRQWQITCERPAVNKDDRVRNVPCSGCSAIGRLAILAPVKM